MIERYSISAAAEKLRERFSIEVPDAYTPRFNAAPTQILPVITLTAPQGLSWFYWGQPPGWAKNKTLSEKIINVRFESLGEKPVLKKSMMKSRCLVPADSFFAWKKVGKKITIPYRFVLANQDIFSIPALWEEFEDQDSQEIHTFTIITTEASELVRTVHERMPVLFDRQAEKKWMNPESTESDLLDALKPNPSIILNHYPVSPRINATTIDVPSLLIPTPPADQFGNLTLFD